MQKTNFELVKEFHRAFGVTGQEKPSFPSDAKVRAIRFGLIDEEYHELEMAHARNDIIGIADALTDMLYVIYGFGDVYGIDLDACFREIHRSNMTKLGEDGMPVYREDGKVLKGPNFTPPDLGSILNVERESEERIDLPSQPIYPPGKTS